MGCGIGKTQALLTEAKGGGEQLSAPQALGRDWAVVQLGSLMPGAMGPALGSRSDPKAQGAGAGPVAMAHSRSGLQPAQLMGTWLAPSRSGL